MADHAGYFEITGDRVTFYSAEDRLRLRVLENLMLERVARAIEELPGRVEWSVSGVVTEYRGGNYLLLTHAVLTTRRPGSGRVVLPAGSPSR